MSKAEKKVIAEGLFIKTTLTRKEIAAQVGVSQTTLRDWIEKGGWESIKQSGTIKFQALLEESIKQLEAINKRINDEHGGVPNKELSDAKAVIRKEIEVLSKKPLFRYVEVMEDFQGWTTKHHPEDLQKVTKLSMKFIEDIAAQKF